MRQFNAGAKIHRKQEDEQTQTNQHCQLEGQWSRCYAKIQNETRKTSKANECELECRDIIVESSLHEAKVHSLRNTRRRSVFQAGLTLLSHMGGLPILVLVDERRKLSPLAERHQSTEGYSKQTNVRSHL